MDEMKASLADAVAQPPETRLIELPTLKQKDGSAVVVELKRADALKVGSVTGQLPGTGPAGGRESQEVGIERSYDIIIAVAVQPKFTRESEPTNGAIPISWLSMLDMSVLSEAATHMCRIGGDRFPS